MLENDKKLGAFIIPTGVGASIGGYAGDGSFWARKFAQRCNLIVNPNVVNAGCFSGITDNMLYVEGYSIDSFFKGEISLKPSFNNKIAVVFDKAIPEDVLNVHINTINAVKMVYGIDIIDYVFTEENVGVGFNLNEEGISVGSVDNVETLLNASKKVIEKGADAIALVCYFEDPAEDNIEYASGKGVDPIGGVEAILSHYISKELKVPCAHSPAFADYQIYSDIVNPKSAAEYITPTFLPCVFLGLNNAPKIVSANGNGININNLDFLVMPYDCLGSTPVYEASKRGITVYAVRENSSCLDVTSEKLNISENITIIETYQECLNTVLA